MATLWLVVRRDCNLACDYCYQTDRNPGSHLRMVPGLSRAMPERVWRAGATWARTWPHDKAPLDVVLYGGEPLLAFQELERLVPAWNLAFFPRVIQWHITTNGTRLDDRARAFLDRFGIAVLLSLDGPKRLHDQARPTHDGRSSWDQIDPEAIAKWRPRGGLEVAWQLDPKREVTPADFDELVAVGFRGVNINLNWLAEWTPEARIWLTLLMRHIGRRCLRGEVSCNWSKKLERALMVDARMEQPCGTGLGMLALTPEGWLYPSQEMAFNVFDPGKAPGTPEHYRVGNVLADPVLDQVAIARVSGIKVEEMRVTAPGHACDNCIARTDCIGSCHCRLVGQRHEDPGYRFDVPAGYCQSNVAAHTGLLQAAAIERWIRPVTWKPRNERTPLPIAGWGRAPAKDDEVPA
jgi:uncharacterized protein